MNKTLKPKTAKPKGEVAKRIQKRRNSTVKKEFSEKELEELKTGFVLLDKNEDGQVSVDELSEMLCRLGLEMDEEWLQELLKCASHTGNELIDENDFLLWIKKIQTLRPEEIGEEDTQKDLMAAFKVFDLDSNGFITRDELRTAMETIGEAVTEHQLTELITLADSDKDGKINYEEFATLLL